MLVNRLKSIGIGQRPWVNRVDNRNHLYMTLFQQFDSRPENLDLIRYNRCVIPLFWRIPGFIDRLVHPHSGCTLLARFVQLTGISQLLIPVGHRNAVRLCGPGLRGGLWLNIEQVQPVVFYHRAEVCKLIAHFFPDQVRMPAINGHFTKAQMADIVRFNMF